MSRDVLHVFERANRTYGVFLLDNDSGIQRESFLNSFYKSFGFKEQLNSNWYEWFYTDNPLGYCNNYILVDLQKDTWIGGFGFAKKNYSYDGNAVVGGLAVNGFINPGYEGLGLYTGLISEGLNNESYSRSVAFSFPHQLNLASIKGHLKSGWLPFIKMSFIEIVIDGNEKSSGRVDQLNDPMDLSEIDFACVNLAAKLSFPRDYSELAWRYVSRPDKQYSYLAVAAGEGTGYMVLAYYTTREGNRRCQVADYRYSTLTALKHLIEEARFVAANKKCQVLDVLINPACECYEIYRNCGFVGRNEGYDLMTFSENPLQLGQDALVTFGDFDVV